MDETICFYCRRPAKDCFTHPSCKGNIDGLFIFASYKGPMRKIIHAIKYEGIFAACSDLAKLSLSTYSNQFNFDYLVPVPLSNQRLGERGFNQTERLAKVIGKELGKEVVNILQRNRNTKPQFDLSFDERKLNLSEAFSLSKNLKTKNLKGLSFCIVDDVMTTGATLEECAKVLKESGANKIYLIVVAHHS